MSNPNDQLIGGYRDLLTEYVTLYKKAAPRDETKSLQRERDLVRLTRKLAEVAREIGADYKEDLRKRGAGL